MLEDEVDEFLRAKALKFPSKIIIDSTERGYSHFREMWLAAAMDKRRRGSQSSN